MSRLQLDVQVAIRSPFLFQGLEPARFGYDATAIRDDGNPPRPIIPGDHLRGHLRHAMTAIAEKTEASDSLVRLLFGDESPKRNATQDGPQDLPVNRGLLIVKDLVVSKDIPTTFETYPRVKIEAETGAAEDGMLQTIELVAKIGAVLLFKGTMVVRPHPRLPIDIHERLSGALKLVPAMGAIKSAGFGEIVHEQTYIRLRGPVSSPRPSGRSADRLTTVVEFDQPLLVNAARASANSFAGATVLPGGAIKGALAEALRDEGHSSIDQEGDVFGREFSRISISHAFPLAPNGDLADRAIPNSLAAVTPSKADQRILLGDMVEPGAFERLAAEGTPAFLPDWKPKIIEHVRDRLRRPASGLRNLPRGRVKIDARGVADEGNLFVVSPIGVTGRRWQFTIDRNGADPQVFDTVLARLAGGLDGVGRTGATMTAVVGCAQSTSAPPPPGATKTGTQLIVITLETPAVLTDPDDRRRPREQYEATFRDLSGANGIAVVDCFAQRAFYGNYMGFRFRAFGSGRYQPFEVTEPGAVFAVKPDPEGVFAAWLSQVAQTRLPAIRRAGAVATIELDWRSCPFVPENGYGEISVGIDVTSLIAGS